ncbi:MAG: hypothetical protein ACFFBS_01155, partial [Promethearchaeota archaeon]
MGNLTNSKIKELLCGAFKCPANGWVRLHLRGTPYQVGFQHGYLLANEVKNAVNILGIFFDREYNIPWSKFRQIAEELYLPKVPDEQKEEMKGISEGVQYAGIKDVDVLD